MSSEGRFYLDVGVPDFKSTVPTYSGEIRSLFTGFGGFGYRGISDLRYPIVVV